MTEKNKKLRKPSKRTRMYAIISAIVAVALVAVLIALIVSSKRGEKQTETETTDSAPAEVTTAAAPETKEPETTESAPETEPEKFPEPTYAHASNIVFTAVEGETAPQYTNPLTGEELGADLAGQRPVSVMINNIRTACPQEGVSQFDIMYEILAEGGITRLLMLKQDYASLGVIGSIRSSRKYFIDMSQNYDAIYVHAGGSEEAYSEIPKRKIDHLDGVRTDSRTGINVTNLCYYRDQWRRTNMGYEHSLMSTGELIVKGIERYNYRTEIKSGLVQPVQLIDPGYKVELNGESGKYVKMTYRPAHYPEYEYDEATGKYLRYQFQHEKHVDGTNNEQLAFTNVIILVMKHANTGDDKNHINIQTTGTGKGYYFTGGKYIPITWEKSDVDGPMKLSDADGNRLVVNKGKTAINIISPYMDDNIVIN